MIKSPLISLSVAALFTLSGCALNGDGTAHPHNQRSALHQGQHGSRPKYTAHTASKVAKKKAASETSATLPKTFRVRTTAYTGKKNAIGTALSHGPVISAASDWSRFPLGTRFRIRQTGKTYVIDDYGSALVGTKTIDLAKRSKSIVNAWGVRWVDIDIIEWGSSRKSLEILTPRQKVRYVKPMVNDLRRQAHGIPHEFHRLPM